MDRVPRLTDKAVKDMERGFVLKRRAIEILGIVNAEWQSDPQSVQCFDLRLVKEADAILAELNKLERFY
jgi:hypothetical protein